MLNKITVSAPGKLMLFGEHAAVYGFPCIVTAVDQRLTLTLEPTNSDKITINAPELQLTGYAKNLADIGKGEIPKAAQIIEAAISVFHQKYPLKKGFTITTKCGFSPNYGFGSSSASAVTTIKALSALTSRNLDQSRIFKLAFAAVRLIQPKNSGFDVAAATWGGTLIYQLDHPVQELNFDLIQSNAAIIVGYTGVKADTPTLVGQVADKRNQNPVAVSRIFMAVSDIVTQAKVAMAGNDFVVLGKLMNFNQDYLRNLGVSSEKLETLISAAKNNGAYGAKLSGAGGGDCMIAIAPKAKVEQINREIEASGGEPVNVAIGAEGVKIENN